MTWKLILYGSIKLSRTELHVSQYMLFVCLLTVSGDFTWGSDVPRSKFSFALQSPAPGLERQ